MTAKTDSVEKLGRTQPPPGYVVRPDMRGAFGPHPTGPGYEFACGNLIRGSYDAEAEATAAAWVHYESEHDPPGMEIRSDGLVPRRWVFDVGVLSFFGPDGEGFSAEGEARAAAWRRYWRCVDLIERARKLARARDRQDLNSGLAEGWAEILTWPETELAREEGELAALEEVVRA